eukprot:TRINITY_DN6490_c0_g2_i2.p1 TRINITY_DN6490_c0_g2~~TRINITY_DN6490_c0_g2_i2.p1  ORF type:complete len:200 (-),score=40.91 TRINITY_DN6490_c0_g2_i2:194-793(-)
MMNSYIKNPSISLTPPLHRAPNLRIDAEQKKRMSISETPSRRASDAANFSLNSSETNSLSNKGWASTHIPSESEAQKVSNVSLDELQSKVDQWRNEYYKESYLGNGESSTRLSHQIKAWKDHLKGEIKDSTESLEVQFTTEAKDSSHSIEGSPLVWSHNWHENFQQLMNSDSLFIETEMDEMNATLNECRNSMRPNRKD